MFSGSTMPKKFASENTKAVAARARKEAAKEEKMSQMTKAEEDAQWADDDKHAARKLERKKEQEKKKTEQLQKKAEAKALLEAEAGSIGASSQAAKNAKLTRAQITVRLRAFIKIL